MKTRSNKCQACGCSYASKTHQTRCAGKTIRAFRANNRAAYARTHTTRFSFSPLLNRRPAAYSPEAIPPEVAQ